MRSSGFCVFLFLFLFNTFIDFATAQNIDFFVNRAFERNGELAAARQQVAEAQALLLQAGFRPNPAIEVSVTNGSVLGSAGEGAFKAGYAHTFELGGKRERRTEAAEIALELARSKVSDRERELRADVKRAFVSALAFARNIRIAEDLLETNEIAVRIARARIEQGEGAPLEGSLLDVELNRIAADRVLLESQSEQALLELRTLLGTDDSVALKPAGELKFAPVSITLEAALDRAFTRRPDLATARLDETLAAAELRLAESEAVPNAVGFLRYSHTKSRFPHFGLTSDGNLVGLQDTDNALTAGVSINLPVRNRNQGNIQAALARQRSARLRREFLEQVISWEVRTALSRYTAAQRALSIFDKEVMQQAGANLITIRRTYELGATPVLDVIAEQRRFIEVQRAYTENLREYALSLINLERSVGAPIF